MAAADESQTPEIEILKERTKELLGEKCEIEIAFNESGHGHIIVRDALLEPIPELLQRVEDQLTHPAVEADVVTEIKGAISGFSSDQKKRQANLTIGGGAAVKLAFKVDSDNGDQHSFFMLTDNYTGDFEDDILTPFTRAVESMLRTDDTPNPETRDQTLE